MTPVTISCSWRKLRDPQLSLFYLDGSNNVIQASLVNAIGSTGLSLSGTQSIQSGTNVDPLSSIGAIYLDAQWGYRVYYQTTDGTLQELVGSNGWNTGEALSFGISGTPITVAAVTAPDLQVFYINKAINALYFQAYKGGWSARLSPPCMFNQVIS